MHDDENCPWRKLAEELLEDNRQLLDEQQQHIVYLKQQVAEGKLRHGEPDAALAFLAEADPHEYLDIPEV